MEGKGDYAAEKAKAKCATFILEKKKKT